MAIYIAVFDTHPGDRKQFERLLLRESGSTLDTGILYVDSYGSESALLATPMKYDLFLLDVEDESENTHSNQEIVSHLREIGICCPIAIYSNNIKEAEVLEDKSTHLLPKPINKDMLRKLIFEAIRDKETRAPRIELREDKNTYYVTADEIMYAVEKDRFVDVTLTNGRRAHILGELVEICVMVDGNNNFLQLSNSTLVNMDYISEEMGRAFLMSDHELLSFNFFDQWRVLNLYREYKDKNKAL